MIRRLNQELGEISAEEAIIILIDDFNLGLGTVRFSKTNTEYTISGLQNMCKGQKIAATAVSPIFFAGGPPNDTARIFKGSLLTLLFDRIMYEYCVTGAFADLVT